MYYDTLLKRTIGLAVVILICGHVMAQDANEAEIPSLETFIQTENLFQELNMPSSLVASATSNSKSGITSGDASRSVYILQIGAQNQSRTNIRSSNSAMTLLQNGNGNRSDIRASGKTVLHNILQNGHDNSFLEYGNVPSLNLERNIMQDGNDHSVAIFGSNSLTESMTLKLEGNSESVTIRNFN